MAVPLPQGAAPINAGQARLAAAARAGRPDESPADFLGLLAISLAQPSPPSLLGGGGAAAPAAWPSAALPAPAPATPGPGAAVAGTPAATAGPVESPPAAPVPAPAPAGTDRPGALLAPAPAALPADGAALPAVAPEAGIYVAFGTPAPAVAGPSAPPAAAMAPLPVAPDGPGICGAFGTPAPAVTGPAAASVATVATLPVGSGEPGIQVALGAPAPSVGGPAATPPLAVTVRPVAADAPDACVARPTAAEGLAADPGTYVAPEAPAAAMPRQSLADAWLAANLALAGAFAAPADPAATPLAGGSAADLAAAPGSAAIGSEGGAGAAPAVPAAVSRQVSVQILKLSADAATPGGRLTLRLDPPQLGRVEVSFEQRDGRLLVTLTAQTPEAERALRSGAGELQQALAGAGGKWHDAQVKIEPAAGREEARPDGDDTGEQDEQPSRRRRERGDG